VTTPARTLARCPVCDSRLPILSEGRFPPHPWVEPVWTFGLFGQTLVLEYRGWCPGEGLLP
jgi:hypothetical protein